MNHGLLLEDFKQSLINLITTHQLDVQSKTLVMEYLTSQLQITSNQTTKDELLKIKHKQNNNIQKGEQDESNT